MILRPVRPVSPSGPPVTKLPVGLIRNCGRVVQHLVRQSLPDHFLDDEAADLGLLDVFRVLGGNDDVRNADRHAALVDHGDLRLRVGTEPARLAALADAGQLATEAMREHDRRRHQFRRLVAGKTEHQTLVARALLGVAFAFRIARVHALRDVGALAGDDVLNVDLVGVKNVVVVHVTDLAHGIAHDLSRSGRPIRAICSRANSGS